MASSTLSLLEQVSATAPPPPSPKPPAMVATSAPKPPPYQYPPHAVHFPVPIDPSPDDVLLGPDVWTSRHGGNVRFRTQVGLHGDEYRSGTPHQQACLAHRVVNAVRSATHPPGRFLARHPLTHQWIPLPYPAAIAHAAAALRTHASDPHPKTPLPKHAKPPTAKQVEAQKKKKERRKKQARTPKPYTDYTIYFRLERARLLQLDGKIDDEVLPSLDPRHSDPLERPRPQGYEDVVLEPYWYCSSHKAVIEKRRRHRKRTGRMDLKALSQTISKNWREAMAAGSDVVGYCQRIARAELERYNALELARLERKFGTERMQGPNSLQRARAAAAHGATVPAGVGYGPAVPGTEGTVGCHPPPPYAAVASIAPVAELRLPVALHIVKRPTTSSPPATDMKLTETPGVGPVAPGKDNGALYCPTIIANKAKSPPPPPSNGGKKAGGRPGKDAAKSPSPRAGKTKDAGPRRHHCDKPKKSKPDSQDGTDAALPVPAPMCIGPYRRLEDGSLRLKDARPGTVVAPTGGKPRALDPDKGAVDRPADGDPDALGPEREPDAPEEGPRETMGADPPRSVPAPAGHTAHAWASWASTVQSRLRALEASRRATMVTGAYVRAAAAMAAQAAQWEMVGEQRRHQRREEASSTPPEEDAGSDERTPGHGDPLDNAHRNTADGDESRRRMMASIHSNVLSKLAGDEELPAWYRASMRKEEGSSAVAAAAAAEGTALGPMKREGLDRWAQGHAAAAQAAQREALAEEAKACQDQGPPEAFEALDSDPDERTVGHSDKQSDMANRKTADGDESRRRMMASIHSNVLSKLAAGVKPLPSRAVSLSPLSPASAKNDANEVPTAATSNGAVQGHVEQADESHIATDLCSAPGAKRRRPP